MLNRNSLTNKFEMALPFNGVSTLPSYGRQVTMQLVSPLRKGKDDVEAEIYRKSKNESLIMKK